MNYLESVVIDWIAYNWRAEQFDQLMFDLQLDEFMNAHFEDCYKDALAFSVSTKGLVDPPVTRENVRSELIHLLVDSDGIHTLVNRVLELAIQDPEITSDMIDEASTQFVDELMEHWSTPRA